MKPGSAVPATTLFLIAVNIAVAFVADLQPEIVLRLAFDPSAPTFHAAITSLFLHANFLHLLGNMVFLAAVGPAMESASGALRLLATYFLGGLLGVLAHLLLAPKSGPVPLLMGASGAVAACVAYVTVSQLGTRVYMAPKVTAPLLVVVILWVVLQLVGAAASLGTAESGTAYWAHVGGFAGGLVLALTLRTHKQAARDLGRHKIDKMTDRSPAAIIAAAERHLRSHPKDLHALEELADAYASLGDKDHEASTLLRIIDRLPELEQVRYLERLGEIQKLALLNSGHRVLLAERIKTAEPDLARAILRSVLEGPKSDKQRPEALLALANLEGSAEAEPGRSLVRELLEHYPLHPAAEVARAKGWTC